MSQIKCRANPFRSWSFDTRLSSSGPLTSAVSPSFPFCRGTGSERNTPQSVSLSLCDFHWALWFQVSTRNYWIRLLLNPPRVSYIWILPSCAFHSIFLVFWWWKQWWDAYLSGFYIRQSRFLRSHSRVHGFLDQNAWIYWLNFTKQ